jgi:MFS transporter, DHA1 family, solute carrier family 18 (vesicular amine transporter), member 1/2
MVLLAVSGAAIALPSSLRLVIAALIFFGASYSVASTPTLPLLGEFVTANGGGAYGQVYALWNMAYSIGILVCPVVGGVLLQYFGFLWAMMCFAITLLLTTIFMMGERYICSLFDNRNNYIRLDGPSAVTLAG